MATLDDVYAFTPSQKIPYNGGVANPPNTAVIMSSTAQDAESEQDTGELLDSVEQQDMGELLDSVEQDMGELLDSVEQMKPLRRGDVVEGIVMRADPDGIFVNIGHKAEGVVPPAEMKTLNAEAREQLQVGDELVTFVVRPETGDHGAILSIDRAEGEKGWRHLQKMLEAGSSIEGTVEGFNRGGAIVEVEGVQGFVPMSQLVSISRDHFRVAQEARTPPVEETAGDGTQETVGEGTLETTGDETEATTGEGTLETTGDETEATTGEGTLETTGDETEATTGEGTLETAGDGTEEGQVQEQEQAQQEDPFAADIGKVLQLKVLEVNRGRNRAIFSERRAMQEWRDEQKARLIEELTEGEVRSGKVTGISSFGAFVDLGGADGLIHISELSWNQVNSPEEIVSPGEELDVFVLRVDAENKKIALSLKRLQPEPWETINERHQVGDIVDATVTKLTNFGAFARVEGSVEGLIHISELTSRMISHPREVIREGDAVKLKVLRIEAERRRLGLSLRQAEEELA